MGWKVLAFSVYSVMDMVRPVIVKWHEQSNDEHVCHLLIYHPVPRIDCGTCPSHEAYQLAAIFTTPFWESSIALHDIGRQYIVLTSCREIDLVFASQNVAPFRAS